MENDGRPIWACSKCHHILDFDTRTNQHVHTASAPEGHAEQPVLASDLDYVLVVCDFCGKHVPDGAIWTVPCTTFEMPMVIATERRRMSVGDWAACPACAGLISVDNWDHLWQRVMHTHNFPLDHPAGPWMTVLHVRIKANITGKPYLEPAGVPTK